MRIFRWPFCLLLLLVLALTPWCVAKESAEVTVNYVLAPPRPLPEGLKAIAVIDSGVETQGAREDRRERKWSTMAADMIESMLANSAMRFGSGLQVAQRRVTKQILQEKDLRLAGLVDAPMAEQAGKLLAVQGLITSRITINIDVQKTRKSTVDWGQLMGVMVQGMTDGGRAGPPPPAQPGYVVRPAPAPVQGRPAPAPAQGRPAYPPQNRPAPARPGNAPQNRSAPDPRDRRTTPAPRIYSDPRSRDPRTLRYRRYNYNQGYRAQPGVAPRPGVVMVQPAPVIVQPAPVAAMPPGPGGYGGLGTKEVEEVSRHLTVQCTFTLVDAVTGQAIVHYAPPPYQKVDRASPDFLFGSMQEGQLDPVDHFIGELVERAAQEFVSLLVPTEVEYRYLLTAKHSKGEAGIRAVRADDFDTAFEQFEGELQKSKKSHEAAFALGVISELKSEPDRALSYYRQAASMDDVEDDELRMYVSAKKRLTEQKGRIMKPSPGGPLPAGAPPAAEGEPPAATEQQ